MTATLRPLERSDVDAVAVIEAAANPSPWSAGMFEAELALPGNSRHWLVAQSDGEVVGFAGMMYAASTAHLMNLAVAPRALRRGIAQQLCIAVYTEAKARGAEDLTLEVRVSNEAAIALYRKLDMVSVGTRPGYYPDGEDAEIFWIHDLQAAEVGAHLEELRRA